MSAVFVTQRLPASALDRLSSMCEFDLYRAREPLTSEVLCDRVRGKQGLICLPTDRIDGAVLEAGSDLRVVANVAVGFDNIDVAEAGRRGVVVTNTPDVLTASVAEYTWGLILAVSRRIAEGDRVVRAGAWPGWSLEFLLGTELRGKRLGIVGGGRIGRAVAAIAGAFGVEVVAARHGGAGPRIVRASQGPNAREATLAQVSFDELLVSSDIVSLHVPLTEATRHLIDRRALARMKRSAYLVNMSRGPVVDEDALVWALEERLIAGAALDVYEREPTVHAGLLALDTVVLSPHLGSATRETRGAMADLAVANVLAVLDGRPPLTPVTPRA